MSDRTSNVSFHPVDDKARRLEGELRIEHPVLVLATFAPRFAAWLLDRRGPWLAPIPNDAMVRALGGLDANGKPQDASYRVDAVRQCVEAFAREPYKSTAVDPRLKAYARESLPQLESVADYVHTAVAQLVAFYRQTAEAGHGIDVVWHR